jgi:surface carbohydrate biosynthesis protein
MSRILILADHMWRDVPSLASVQVHIEKHSEHHVVTCDIHLLAQMVEIFKPHLVVLPHLHDKNRNAIVDSVRRRGGLCAILGSENRPNTVGQTEWITQKFPAELCDLFLCWTDWIRDELKGRVPAIVTGCPRFDFYFRPVDRLQIISEYGLDPDKPIITVASSFPQAKFATVGGDFLETDWKNLGMTTIKGFENPKETARLEKIAQDRFATWISALHVEYPEFQIILKPHPAEDVRYWQRFDFTLMLSDYITNLLAISDVHIARVGCLTIPEAWILHKPTVQCQMGNETVDGASGDAVIIDPTVTTVTQMLEGVEAGLTNEWDDYMGKRYPEDYIKKYLGEMPGSAKRVAWALISLLEEKKPTYAFEFTHQDLLGMNRLLADHSRQYQVPSFDHLGQFNKSCTRAKIDGFLSDERIFNA